MTTTRPASCQMKTHDILALIFLGLLCLFGVLSFFVIPRFADGVKDCLHAVIDGLGMILSFKFGVHVASQPGLASTLGLSTTQPLDTSIAVSTRPDSVTAPAGSDGE